MASTIPETERSHSEPETPGVFGSSPWRTSAPRQLARHCLPGKGGKGWEVWQEHLAKRSGVAVIADLLDTQSQPLLWSLPDELSGTSSEAFIDQLTVAKKAKRQALLPLVEVVEPWLAESVDSEPNSALGLECLAVAHALPQLARVLEPALWWELLETVVQAVDQTGGRRPQTEPLADQLLLGELSLTLGYLFPELKTCRKLAQGARQTISAGMVDMLDGEGLTHGSELHLLRPLLTCWTRSWAIDREMEKKCFSSEARNQYQWLVLNALRYARRDGSQMLSSGSAGSWHPDLFHAALRFGGDKLDRNAAKIALPGGGSSSAKKAKALNVPDPATNSEWSALAMLRSDWTPRGHRLAVDYHDKTLRLELESGKTQIFAGTWDCEVTVDGKKLGVSQSWEELCWYSDEDVDYLELETKLDGGVTVQRQILLAREDDFLYMTDIVLGKKSAKLEYRGSISLGDRTRFLPEEETREGFLQGERKEGLVIPLAQPEWRVDPRIGSLTSDDESLELRQQATGQNLCAPLFIDLDRRRINKACTWRQLTIAEYLEIQPAEVAAGYRVQVGKRQWMFYRSLAKPSNRSLLGQNLSSEFFAARFDRNGDAEELIEIEPTV